MSNGSEKGELKKALGPFQLWVIGVGAVISGNYFGWNFGIASAGYGGFLISIALMAIMYLAMILSISELSTLMPYAGGPYAFARRAMGQLPAFITGIGVVLEYFIAAPVVALGVGGYVNFLIPGADPVLVAVILYGIFAIVHIIGIGEYAALETVFTILALGLIVLMYFVGFPHVETVNLFGVGGSNILPNGFQGVWAGLPFAMWLFLAIEMLPMLAEETKNPEKDLPKGAISSIVTMLILCYLTTTCAVGLGGAAIGTSAYPLADAVAVAFGKDFWLAKILASVGLVGLLASFSAVMLAYSRQIFALSRMGYLPAFFSKLHPTRKTPVWSIVLPAIVGLLLVMFINPDELILLATFGALLSYIAMMVSVMILKAKEPNLHRPYKVPLGNVLPAIGTVFATIALFSSVFREPKWFLINMIILTIAIIYYFTWARHHINLDAPEEASAIAAKAENE